MPCFLQGIDLESLILFVFGNPDIADVHSFLSSSIITHENISALGDEFWVNPMSYW